MGDEWRNLSQKFETTWLLDAVDLIEEMCVWPTPGEYSPRDTDRPADRVMAVANSRRES
jgi:hypothetical protein